jgi:SAM-dependent methyltransferase
MDQQITVLFEKMVNSDLAGITISNSSDKDKVKKIKIRPVLIKNELYFQTSEYIGDKVFHSNLNKEEIINTLPEWFEGLFHQAEILTDKGKVTVLISKKGKVTIINKTNNKLNASESEQVNTQGQKSCYSHNRSKNYILQEGIALPFLIDLGIMSKDGYIIKSKSDKFRQINRFLEYIEDILPQLDKDKELTILDFGCGKSYLTFAMYYYMKELKGYSINVTGMDLKEDVIAECNRLSMKYGYENLHFMAGNIADYEGDRVDMVVTLHACDTATDYALFNAISRGAKVILSVPCCQHELNKQIDSEILKPILKYGIIKERMSALITDALRADIIETMGYHVQLLEFIDMEHTPKNILIRAVKSNQEATITRSSDKKLEECMDFLRVSPCLSKLLSEK